MRCRFLQKTHSQHVSWVLKKNWNRFPLLRPLKLTFFEGFSIIPVWGSLWRNPKLGLLKILIWGSVSVFVRGVIWQWAERYNCNIMSQILSFLTHLTSLPVGSISSSHSKISAICWCQNWDIWLILRYLVKIGIFGWYCDIWLIL